MGKKSKVQPFAQVPLEVLYNSELSHSARVLYALILSKVSKEGHCYAANETLAEWLGTSISTVVKRLKELKSKDLIKTFYTTTEAGSARKIYPQIIVKGDVENQQKDLSKSTSNNSLSKERQRKVLWQRPSPFSALDSNESTPNEK